MGIPDTIGQYDPQGSQYLLRNSNTSGVADISAGFGPPGGNWKPVTGDWNDDSIDTLGIYDSETASWFHLRNSNTSGPEDLAFGFGAPGAHWIPLAGDWNGDGQGDTPGLFNPSNSNFYFRNSNTGGVAEVTIGFGGPSTWLPIAGDWNGDGSTTIALYDPAASQFYIKNQLSTGVADYAFGFGTPGGGWLPFAGQWGTNGKDAVGLFDPVTGQYYLRNSAEVAGALLTTPFGFGMPNANRQPLAGHWNNPPTISTITTQTINEDASTGALAFTVGDGQTAPASLIVTATSSPAPATMVLGGSEGNRTVSITPAQNWNGATTITLTVNDGQGYTASSNFVLTVNAVNDAPVLSPGPEQRFLPAINEDDGNNAGVLVSDFAAAMISDPDGPNEPKGIALLVANGYARGAWQYATNAGQPAWQPVGTVTTDVALFLAADANTRVRFVPANNYAGTIYAPYQGLTFLAWDQSDGKSNGNKYDTGWSTTRIGSLSSGIAGEQLVVNPINDPPLRTSAPPAAINVSEDSANITAVALGLSGLAYGVGGGSDESSQTFSCKVTAIPSYVSLFKSDGTPISANTPLSLTELRGLTYKTIANANGSGTLTWTVQDNGGTANGGFDTLTENLSITINAVNDRPTATDKSLVVLQGNPFTFAAPDFGFADSIDVPAHLFLAVKNASLASSGSLSYNGQPVAVAQVVSTQDIGDGLLQFTPAASGGTSATVSFTFQVQDTGGTAQGGQDLSNAATFSFLTLPPAGDYDQDGLANTAEFEAGTNPLLADTDGDQLPDGWEVQYGLKPLSGDQNGNGTPDRLDDFDGDGLQTMAEYVQHHTNPKNADTDNDTVSDGLEVGQGSNPADPTDDGGPLPDNMKHNAAFALFDNSMSRGEIWSMQLGTEQYTMPGYGVGCSGNQELAMGTNTNLAVNLVSSITPDGPDCDIGFAFSNMIFQDAVWFNYDGELFKDYAFYGDYFEDDPHSPDVVSGKTGHLSIGRLDVDVDSANDSGFEVPVDNILEDRLEDDPYDGKLIMANTGDVDGDGTLDYNDYYVPGLHFVPMVLRLSENTSELASSGYVGLGDGYPLRFWTKDADVPRTAADILPPYVTLTPGQPTIVYVEATGEPGRISFTVEAAPHTFSSQNVTGISYHLSDEVGFMITAFTPRVNLQVWNGQYQEGATPLKEGKGDGFKQFDPATGQGGAFTVVNWNDTNGDGVPDSNEDRVVTAQVAVSTCSANVIQVSSSVPVQEFNKFVLNSYIVVGTPGTNVTRKITAIDLATKTITVDQAIPSEVANAYAKRAWYTGRDEVDLMPLRIAYPGVAMQGNVELHVPMGIRLWSSSTKETALPIVNGVWTSPAQDIPPNGLMLWAEFTHKIATVGDAHIVLSYSAAPGVTDSVDATGIWAECTQIWNTQMAWTALPTDLQEDAKLKETFDNSHGLGVLPGLFGAKNPATLFFSNGILFQFTVSPAGLDKQSVVQFDGTRQKKVAVYDLVGQNPWVVPGGYPIDWPTVSEEPNDEPRNAMGDVKRSDLEYKPDSERPSATNHFYTFDSPDLQLQNYEQVASTTLRSRAVEAVFAEWMRVGFGTRPDQNIVAGSRCSDLTWWLSRSMVTSQVQGNSIVWNRVGGDTWNIIKKIDNEGEKVLLPPPG